MMAIKWWGRSGGFNKCSAMLEQFGGEDGARHNVEHLIDAISLFLPAIKSTWHPTSFATTMFRLHKPALMPQLLMAVITSDISLKHPFLLITQANSRATAVSPAYILVIKKQIAEYWTSLVMNHVSDCQNQILFKEHKYHQFWGEIALFISFLQGMHRSGNLGQYPYWYDISQRG